MFQSFGVYDRSIEPSTKQTVSRKAEHKPSVCSSSKTNNHQANAISLSFNNLYTAFEVWWRYVGTDPDNAPFMDESMIIPIRFPFVALTIWLKTKNVKSSGIDLLHGVRKLLIFSKNWRRTWMRFYSSTLIISKCSLNSMQLYPVIFSKENQLCKCWIYR